MLNFKTFLENLEHSKNDVHKIVQYSEKLLGIVKPNVELEDWVKAKLTHTEDYLNTVLDYLKYYKQQNEDNNKMAMGDLRSIHEKAKEIDNENYNILVNKFYKLYPRKKLYGLKLFDQNTQYIKKGIVRNNNFIGHKIDLFNDLMLLS